MDPRNVSKITSSGVRSVCRLSPNEEAYLRHAQLEERRKARLLQVREQEKKLAKQLREKVKNKREEERRMLQVHVDTVLAETHQCELRELEEKYLSRMSSVGQGHRNAQLINEEENRLQELRLLLEAKQRWRAQDRHTAAMKELSANQLKDKQSREHALYCRQQALDAEKRRARQIASAGPSSNPMIIMDFDADKSRQVQFKEAEGYSSSYYHIPNPVVERLGTPNADQLTAQEMAQQQAREDKKTEQHSAALQQEHSEKARLRYKHAIAKVKLEKERAEMLVELQSLEREDRNSRQKALAKMPPNMFQPAHRRIEMATEQQREMEGAFERLFIRTLHGAPVANHLTEESTHASEPSLSITEHSSMADSDHPDNDPRLLERERTREETVKITPKITPDSGVHIDATTSTEDTHQPMSSQELLDSGVINESSSLYHTARKTGPTSFTQEGTLTTSSSSSDHQLPHPAQPPQPVLPTMAADRSHDVFSTSTDSEQIASRVVSTQTPERNAKRFLFRPRIMLDRPELTVTDTASSDEQSVEDGDPRGRSLGGRKPPLPTQRKRNEGMKALLSMIQTQHQAWNDRLDKRNELLRTASSSPPNSRAEGSVESDTLSVYTLSTRESTLSPTPPPERADQSSLHSTRFSSSPEQLSVYQYNTTLETSTLPPPPTTSLSTAEESSRTAQGHSLPHPLATHMQKYESPVSTSPQVVPTTLQSDYAETSRNQGDEGSSTNSQPLLSHVTVQSSTSHSSVMSHPATAHQSVPYSLATSHASEQLRISQPTISVLQTPARTSLEESIDSSHTPPLPAGDDTQDTLDSFMTLPETAPPQPLSPAIEQSTQPPIKKSFPLSDGTSLWRYEQAGGSIGPEPLGLSPEPSSDPIPLPVGSERVTFDSPEIHFASSSLPGHPSAFDIPQEQLSILTLDSTQLSLVVDNSPLSSSPVSSPPVSFRSPQSESSFNPAPRDGHSFPAQTGASPTLTQTASEQQGGPKDLTILDTIEESDAEDTVNSSDSFRGDRMQEDPGLSITGLETTGYTRSPSINTSPVEPALTEFSQPQVESLRHVEPTGAEELPCEANKQAHREENSSPSFKRSANVIDAPAPLVHSEGLNLQEAFLNRKKEFVKKSQKRLEQIKASIAEQKLQQASTFKKQTTPVLSKASHSKPSASGIGLQSKKPDSALGSDVGRKQHRVVTFSSPLLQSHGDTGNLPPPTAGQSSTWLSSKEKEKIKKKEMKERNERFYKKLPEVRRKIEEEKRKEIYSTNRDKARHYQEKIRSQMMNKKAAKKTQPTTVTANTKTKPPFK